MAETRPFKGTNIGIATLTLTQQNGIDFTVHFYSEDEAEYHGQARHVIPTDHTPEIDKAFKELVRSVLSYAEEKHFGDTRLSETTRPVVPSGIGESLSDDEDDEPGTQA